MMSLDFSRLALPMLVSFALLIAVINFTQSSRSFPGGFCVSSQAGLDLLRYASRPYLFSASLPPPVVAAALASLDLIENGDHLRERLWRNVAYLHDGLARLGFALAAAESPILAVRLPSEGALVACWTGLLERGVYVNLALPPATPQGVYLLRCSVCAEHTLEQLDRVCDAFAEVAGAAAA